LVGDSRLLNLKYELQPLLDEVGAGTQREASAITGRRYDGTRVISRRCGKVQNNIVGGPLRIVRQRITVMIVTREAIITKGG
jgi:hypothetical protein